MPKFVSFHEEREKICFEAYSIGIDFDQLAGAQARRYEIVRFLVKLPREFSDFVDIVAKDLTKYKTTEEVVNECKDWLRDRLALCGA